MTRRRPVGSSWNVARNCATGPRREQQEDVVQHPVVGRVRGELVAPTALEARNQKTGLAGRFHAQDVEATTGFEPVNRGFAVTGDSVRGHPLTVHSRGKRRLAPVPMLPISASMTTSVTTRPPDVPALLPLCRRGSRGRFAVSSGSSRRRLAPSVPLSRWLGRSSSPSGRPPTLSGRRSCSRSRCRWHP